MFCRQSHTAVDGRFSPKPKHAFRPPRYLQLHLVSPDSPRMGNSLPFGLTKDHLSLEKYTFPYLRGKNWPSDREESPYDPLEGFPKGRKERVMIATVEEMDSAKLTPPFRDYCAHKWIDYQACLKNNRPFYWRCRHERHAYGECMFEDSVLRMKEWEREKRLNERAKRREASAA